MKLSTLFLAIVVSISCIQISSSLSSNAITRYDEEILKELGGIFTPLFFNERQRDTRQFAVLYYGGDYVSHTLTRDVMNRCQREVQRLSGRYGYFLDSPKQYYDINQCPFIAAKLIAPRQPQDRHTEKTIIKSLNTCPAVQNKNGNYYMYSYFEPCSHSTNPCDALIVNFAKNCSNRFNRLLIGYSKPFSGGGNSILNSKNVAQKKILYYQL